MPPRRRGYFSYAAVIGFAVFLNTLISPQAENAASVPYFCAIPSVQRFVGNGTVLEFDTVVASSGITTTGTSISLRAARVFSIAVTFQFSSFTGGAGVQLYDSDTSTPMASYRDLVYTFTSDFSANADSVASQTVLYDTTSNPENIGFVVSGTSGDPVAAMGVMSTVTIEAVPELA